MNFTAAPGVNMNWYANFKTLMSRNSSNVTFNCEFQTYIADQKV